MPSKKAALWVLYPEYFDKGLTRAQGRRVALAAAVAKPEARQLFRAATTLGLDPALEVRAHHPGNWHAQRGRIVLPKVRGRTKESLLEQLAGALPAAAEELEAEDVAATERARSRKSTSGAAKKPKAAKKGDDGSSTSRRKKGKKKGRRGGFKRRK